MKLSGVFLGGTIFGMAQGLLLGATFKERIESDDIKSSLTWLLLTIIGALVAWNADRTQRSKNGSASGD